MDCTTVRESLSASLDGEETQTSIELVQAHLTRCIGCQNWQAQATDLHRQIRVTTAEVVPDLTASILAAVGQTKPTADESGLRACRILLVACGLMQLIATVPALIGSTGVPIHLDHELGSWDIALAVGFIFAAIRPARAWGMLPIVVAVVAGLIMTASIDISDGNTTLSGESTHIAEFLGLIFLYLVVRFSRAENRNFALVQ